MSELFSNLESSDYSVKENSSTNDHNKKKHKNDGWEEKLLNLKQI